MVIKGNNGYNDINDNCKNDNESNPTAETTGNKKENI